MTNHLIIVFLMTMIIHSVETLSYSIRLAGVRLSKIVVALSLSGIIVLVSRTANLIQAPLTAKFVDFSKTHLSFDLLGHLRIILLAASVGTLIAIGLFPTFVGIFGRVITKLEVAGSIPKLLTSVTIGQLKNTKYYFKSPLYRLSQFRYLGIPKKFIILNIFVTSFYTVGVLSALYAVHLFPQYSTTVSQASGFINGIATILLTVFIDPQLGLITDKALNNIDYRNKLSKIYVLMMTTRFCGTLLAQLVILPASYLIGNIVKMI